MNKEEKESSLIRKLIKLNARFEEKEREREREKRRRWLLLAMLEACRP